MVDSHHVVRTAARMRLVDYAKAHLIVLPVAAVGTLVARGALQLAGRPTTTRDVVRDSDSLSVSRADLDAASPLAPQPIALRILHEDADLLVVDKPAAMHVHPLGAHRTETLHNALLWHAGARDDEPWGAWRPAAAHRLDRAASGLLVIGKHAAAHDALRRLFEAGGVTRRYVAIVDGVPRASAGTIDAPLGRDPQLPYRRAVIPDGQRAITHWRVVAQHGARSELAVELETGRTHQIRAHLASLGHPIAGDTLYATGVASAPRIALHACEILVRHPLTGAQLAIHAPPPADFVTGSYLR